MKIEGALDAKDLTAAELVHLRPKKGHGVLAIILALIVALTAGLAVWDYANGKASPLKPFVWAAGIGCVAAYFLWYSKREARQMIKQYKWLSENTQVELRPDGFLWTTPRGNAILPWDHLYGWREGQSLFLLYMTPELYHVVPKRWFTSTDDVEGFRAALNSNVRQL